MTRLLNFGGNSIGHSRRRHGRMNQCKHIKDFNMKPVRCVPKNLNPDVVAMKSAKDRI
jgi:hypothetical protein